MPQKWNADAFEVRPSTIPKAGNGLFALVHISLEDTIGYYTGKVLDNKAFHDPKRPASDYILYLCNNHIILGEGPLACLLYTSPSPRDNRVSRMPSSA